MARSSLSPVQRTLRELRQQGVQCEKVEHFNSHVGPYGVRQDLFGIIDILALDYAVGVRGIQVCGTDWQSHIKKFREERLQECENWLKTPGTTLELWGWRKVKVKRGGKQMVWKPRVQAITLDFLLEENES